MAIMVTLSCHYESIAPNTTLSDSTNWGTHIRNIWTTQKLTAPIGGTVSTASFLYNDKIIFGYDSVLDCLERNSGKRIWSQGFGLELGVHGINWESIEMISEANRLYLMVGESKLACVDINTGNKIWVFDSKSLLAEGFNRYSVSFDALYIVSRYPPQYIVSVSKSSGLELWRTPLPFTNDNYTPKYSTPGSAVYCNGKVYCGFRGEPGTPPMLGDGGLFILDAITGKLLSTKIFPKPDSSVGFAAWSQMTLNNSNVPIIAYHNNSLILSAGYCIIRADLNGNILWRKGVGYLGHIATQDDPPILLLNDRIYAHNNGSAVSTGAYAYAIDAETGNVLWTQPTKEQSSNPTTTVLVHNGYVDSTTLYKVTDDDWLIGQDLQTGKITWDSDVSPHLDHTTDINVSGGFSAKEKRVYLLSTKNIYCLERVD